MLRRFFQSSQDGGSVEIETVTENGNGRRGHAVEPAAPKPVRTPKPGHYLPFEDVYRTAPAVEPEGDYTILKVAAMLRSSHLAGMSMESKRAALMMALEAASVEVKDILQDAMLRQRALEDYEEGQQKCLREFESFKNEENRKIQAELEKVTAEYMARIQANVDEMAQQQDAFRTWQKTKQQEAAKIAEAVTYCSSADSSLDNLPVVLERPIVRR
jgi:hypothetical protein